MQIRKPIDIIRQILANRGGDPSAAEWIIDALELNGWHIVYQRRAG